MEELNYCVKHGHGKFNYLDRAYNKFIKDSLKNGDDNNIERWEIYNTIMVELLNLGKMGCFEEAKYRLTGGENPNNVMLDIIERDFDVNLSLGMYKNKLNYFIDLDIINRFYKKV